MLLVSIPIPHHSSSRGEVGTLTSAAEARSLGIGRGDSESSLIGTKESAEFKACHGTGPEAVVPKFGAAVAGAEKLLIRPCATNTTIYEQGNFPLVRASSDFPMFGDSSGHTDGFRWTDSRLRINDRQDWIPVGITKSRLVVRANSGPPHSWRLPDAPGSSAWERNEER